MDAIGVAVLLPFLFHVKQSAEYNVAVSGCNVSLEWILLNTPINSRTSFKIYNSSTSVIAEMVNEKCYVADNSSTYCNMHARDNALMVSLTILNVTARQSGSYILQLFTGLKEEGNRSLKLLVVGKPNVIEMWKPILGRPFEMTCSSSQEIESLRYKWRIHGAQTIYMYKGNTYSISSLRMTDHLSQVTCQVCLNETARIFSTEICENDDCSTDSDFYTIQVVYGPNNISLSLSKGSFYLKDLEFFTIDCYADCSPKCSFSWKGPKTTESKKLEITSFESDMAGSYTCHVTNQETNMTSNSNSISLHHVKDDNYKEENKGAVQSEQYWTATVIISVFFFILGVIILVTIRSKSKTRVIDSTELCRVAERQTDTEVFLKDLGRLNKLLHIPKMQPRVSKRTKRSECPNDSQQNNCRRNLQEDPYSTIDDDALSADYDHGISNVIKENSHETRRSIEHAFCDYARSIEICQLATVDVHATDETYLTPNNHNVGLSEILQDEETGVLETDHEILQDEETGVLETDHAYLALINDLTHPIEKCHVEEIDTNETDETYITPINELQYPRIITK